MCECVCWCMCVCVCVWVCGGDILPSDYTSVTVNSVCYVEGVLPF